MSFEKYLTNFITSNENKYDQWANHLLQPIIRLWELKSGMKQVRQFHLHKKLGTPIENTKAVSELSIVGIFRDVLLAVPYSIAGVACKFIATFDPLVLANYSKLFKSSLFIESKNTDALISVEKKETIENKEVSSTISLHSDAILHILTFLKITDIKNLRLVNKGFLTLTNSTVGSKSCEEYRTVHLKGLTLDPELPTTFLSLIFSYNKYIQDNRFKDLVDVFGDVQNIFYYKVYKTRENTSVGDNAIVDALAHSDNFHKYPSVFRLSFRDSNDRHIREVVVIKYSLFVPKEHAESAHDDVWHDCLVISPYGNEKWTISDLRLSEYLPQSSSRRTLGYATFPRATKHSYISQLNEQTFTSSNLIESKESILIESTRKTRFLLNRLINNDTVEFYRQKPENENVQYFPNFIYGSGHRHSSTSKTLYYNLPIKLGHVPVTEFEFSKIQLPAKNRLSCDDKGVVRLDNTALVYKADVRDIREMLTF